MGDSVRASLRLRGSRMPAHGDIKISPWVVAAVPLCVVVVLLNNEEAPKVDNSPATVLNEQQKAWGLETAFVENNEAEVPPDNGHKMKALTADALGNSKSHTKTEA